MEDAEAQAQIKKHDDAVKTDQWRGAEANEILEEGHTIGSNKLNMILNTGRSNTEVPKRGVYMNIRIGKYGEHEIELEGSRCQYMREKMGDRP